MKRGDVHWANLAPRSGSEQQSARPVIVVSHDGFNQSPSWRSVTSDGLLAEVGDGLKIAQDLR